MCPRLTLFDLGSSTLVCQGEFREDNFNTAMQVLRDAGDSGASSAGGKWDAKGRRGGTRGRGSQTLGGISHQLSQWKPVNDHSFESGVLEQGNI